MDELIALIENISPMWCSTWRCPIRTAPSWTPVLPPKTDYVDTANYDPEDTAKFEYKWQVGLSGRSSKEAGI